MSFPPIPQTTATVLNHRLKAGESLTLLDVREPDERDHCRIAAPHSITDLHIPLNEVPNHFEELADAAASGPLVIYCHHGGRSMVAAWFLALRDVPNVENLEGGIDAWSLAIDPSVRRY